MRFDYMKKGGEAVKFKARVVDGRGKDEPWEYWPKPYMSRDGFYADTDIKKNFVSNKHFIFFSEHRK